MQHAKYKQNLSKNLGSQNSFNKNKNDAVSDINDAKDDVLILGKEAAATTLLSKLAFKNVVEQSLADTILLNKSSHYKQSKMGQS